jgi:SAM-dependent methyltransferase
MDWNASSNHTRRMVCKFCHSTSIKADRDIRSPHNGKYYHLYGCQNCRSHFFDISQFKVSLKNLYDNLSTTRGEFPEYFIPSRKWKRQVRIIDQLSSRPTSSILDVGCRTGDFLMHFNPGTRREGIELSDHYAEIARQRGLIIYNDYLENVTFNAKYDVVSSFAILEHIESPLVFLNKLSTIVNPSGILVILIPAYNSLKRFVLDLFHRNWHMYTPPEHLNFFSASFLDNYLVSRGFILVKRSYTSGGMTDLFKSVPLFHKVIMKLTALFDRSFLNRLPVFDHMYSYYVFRN